MKTMRLAAFMRSIVSRQHDAAKQIRIGVVEKWASDETFCELLRKADSAVDDLASYVEENQPYPKHGEK